MSQEFGGNGSTPIKHEAMDNSGNVAYVDHSQNSRHVARKPKNEERKIFVGGITWDTEEQDLQQHFSQFGSVVNVQIKYDHFTRRSRGFAFVEFEDADACQKALSRKDVEIKGKRVEVKPAKSRENKKVFVGGLPSDYSEDQLRAHFEQFGKVDEIEWPFDKFQNRRKNFAFIVFEDDDSASNAASTPKQKFGERMCDVKIAVPQFMRPQRQSYSANWNPSSQYEAYNYNQFPAYNYYENYWNDNYDYANSGQTSAYGDYTAYSGVDGWNYGPPGGAAGQSVPTATAGPTQQSHGLLPGASSARGGRGGYYGAGGYGYSAQ